VTIRESLDEIESWLQKACFQLAAAVVDENATRIIKNWDDLFKRIADNQDLLYSISGSPFYEPFRDRGNTYEYKLSSMHTCLTLLSEVQRKVLYLDPLFLQGSLKNEQAQYNRFVAAPYQKVMSLIESDPLVLRILDVSLHQNLIENLTAVISRLNRCQKALQECLEEKRSLMPRLYFVGDEELLELIGQGSNIEAVQKCLKKLFQAVSRINVDEKRNLVCSIESESGEIVRLNQVSVSDIANAIIVVCATFYDLLNLQARSRLNLVIACSLK
jgi:dynein heavy chain 2